MGQAKSSLSVSGPAPPATFLFLSGNFCRQRFKSQVFGMLQPVEESDAHAPKFRSTLTHRREKLELSSASNSVLMPKRKNTRTQKTIANWNESFVSVVMALRMPVKYLNLLSICRIRTIRKARTWKKSWPSWTKHLSVILRINIPVSNLCHSHNQQVVKECSEFQKWDMGCDNNGFKNLSEH